MASTEIPEPSRRSTRERKQAQHFGHSEPSDALEELIEAPKAREITRAVLEDSKQAGRKPSLLVKLRVAAPSLPPVPLLLESSSENPKKRKAAHINNDDEFAASSSKDDAPKRQRLDTRASKTPKAKVAVNSVVDHRPEPRGQPEVWAEMRQALCESLEYYQAYQSGAYTWGGYAYGFLLDNDNDEHGYMDEKVVITRLGGGMKANNESGKMEQTEDQSSSSNKVTPFANNKRDHFPVILIVGAKNLHCPIKVPHRYNILGHYHVTDIWSESVKGKVVCRVRFEMVDLKTPSWCGIYGSPLPTVKPDYDTKAQCKTCTTCSTSSKEVFTVGWMCLNETCTSFSTINGKAHQGARAWNRAFINERNKWPTHIKAPFPLKPPPPSTLLNNPEMETSSSAWKGMVCPDCGRCNSRSEWDEWKCQTDGCHYEIPIHHTVRPASALTPEHAFETEGHAISFDKWEEPVVRTSVGFHGYWRKATYELSPGNYIAHYFSNQPINRQPGGADEILEALQGSKMGMKRHALESSPVEGDILTRHFGINYGLPYKFVAAPDSKGFAEAPPAILDALNHLTWAGQDTVRDGSYRPFNELLCLGYMESQKIGMHDDGEQDLGPDIASLSLGGAATMTFRMKSKHWLAKGLTAGTYDPETQVWAGSQGWKSRIAANEHYRAGRTAEYEEAKSDLLKFLNKDSEKRKKNGPIMLTLELKHGDMVVMHGEQIQQVHEHSVMPKGKLRYALTGRYIKPENIPVAEHWKGEFTIAPDKVYDGDLALFKAHFPEDEEGE